MTGQPHKPERGSTSEVTTRFTYTNSKRIRGSFLPVLFILQCFPIPNSLAAPGIHYLIMCYIDVHVVVYEL